MVAPRAGTPQPGLAVLLPLLAIGAAVGLAGFALRAGCAGPADSAGICLQDNSASFMLRNTSAEVPPLPERVAPHMDPDRPGRQEQAAPVATASEPSLEAPSRLPPLDLPTAPPPAPVELKATPIGTTCSEPCVIPRGVSPMLRNWRTFVLPTFVTVALTSGPALAGEGAGGKAKLKPLQERLEDINKALEKSFEDVAREIAALKKDVKEVRENQTKLVEPLQRQMAELRTDLELLRKRLPADVALYPPFSADHATLESIRNRLGELESRLSRLQTEPRLALSAPATGRTGRILLVNNYGSDTLFIVRGQSHRVPAGATVEVRNVPAGTFDYEAITPNWDPVRRTTTLAADETLSLVVR